jgi:hypothetical protein
MWHVATLLWGKCEWNSHSQNWDLGVLQDFQNFRVQLQESKHIALGFFYIIKKLTKCRCRKWFHMGYLNICSISYDKKKGQESNWQFNSRPLKVENRLDPSACRWNVTLLESSQGQLQVYFKPHFNWRFEQKVMTSQSFESPNRDNFGTPPWKSRDKKPFECGCRKEAQNILYEGKVELSNRLNFCYYHKFPMKHLLHLNFFWIIYHSMSI